MAERVSMDDEIDSITQGKLDKLTDMLPTWRDQMNDFERSFCSGCVSRYRTYGPQMQMSRKQRNILTEIVFKYDA